MKNWKRSVALALAAIMLTSPGMTSFGANNIVTDIMTSNNFDATYYYNKYTDVATLLGSDSGVLKRHYEVYGRFEGRFRNYREEQQSISTGADMFDAQYYYNRYPDLQSAFGFNPEALYRHWIVFGMKENRIAKATAEENPYARFATSSEGSKSSKSSGSNDSLSSDDEYEDIDTEKDTDGDGVPDYIENLFSSDINKKDTDGDGLSDYIEIYKTATDPTLKDTDGNGVNDGDEDSDGDTLSNSKEVKLGTDPSDKDTDSDGLDDNEEVNKYGTDPIKWDTDGDGLGDGEEVKLGLDPKKSSTDGKTPDGKRKIAQEIDKSEIPDELKTDNKVVPTIKGAVAGDINNHVFIDIEDLPNLEDNRAIVGKQVEVTSDDKSNELTLEFALDKDDERKDYYIICRYDSKEGIVPCETDYNDTTISTAAGSGVYFVIDAEKLLANLGIDTSEIDKTESGDDSDIDTPDEIAAAPMDDEVAHNPVKTASNDVSDKWYKDNYVHISDEDIDIENEIIEAQDTNEDESKKDEIVVKEEEFSEYSLKDDDFIIEEASFESATLEAADELLTATDSKSEDEIIESDDSLEIADEADLIDSLADDDILEEDNIIEIETAAEDELNTDDKTSDNDTEGYWYLKSAIEMENADEIAADISSRAISGQADIVFIIDSTGSMSGAINNVVTNISSFVDSLKKNYSVSVQFALIDYKDITNGEKTNLIRSGGDTWYTNVETLKKELGRIYVTGGGDSDETPIDALGMAHKLDFRSGADKFAVLLTDADYKTDNNYGIKSMKDMANKLKEKGIVTYVISDPEIKSSYKTLYSKTGGGFADIYGDFNKELDKMARKIGEGVADGEWVLLNDFTSVKLNGPDTDGDGLTDKEELGELVVKDMTAYVSKALGKDIHGPIPREVYNYTSNPTIPDTDFDGIGDSKEQVENRMINSFEGKMYLRRKEKKTYYNVDFKVDYRKFFGNNTKYNKDLAVLASLYSQDMYDNKNINEHLEITKGAKGGNKNNTANDSLAGTFGFKDLKDYKLSDEYKDDDITEFLLGHQEVEYNGEKREIILLAIRGTNGTPEEWSSNFDIGANTNSYRGIIGEEGWNSWGNKDNHKGFDVTANRVISKVRAYIDNYCGGNDRGDKAKSIFITGHSRGAAIANIVGACYEDNKYIDSFTYTFASPNTTTDSMAGDYKSIFNIVNTDDLIPYIPIKEWKFKTYGVSKEKKVRGVLGVGFASIVDGEPDYNPNDFIEMVLEGLYKAANFRNTVYMFNARHTKKITYEQYNKLDSFRLGRFCHIDIMEKESKKINSLIEFCPAFALQDLANLAVNDYYEYSKEYTRIYSMKGVDVPNLYEKLSLGFIHAKFGGMEDPHLMASYYLIAKNNKFD